MCLGLFNECPDALTEPVARFIQLTGDAFRVVARALPDEFDRFSQQLCAVIIHGPIVWVSVLARWISMPGWRRERK